jgi:prepilin-type N-terminal cleavage/methylation domain-containing protein
VERGRAFTLIELMITVAVIGILAAIAMPNYEAFLFRAKRAEMPMNLDAIRSNEVGYFTEWDVYTSCVLSPEDVPGRKAVSFPATIKTNLDWNQLGWTPDGKVYGQYEVIATDSVGLDAFFQANAYADIDGDGNLSHYQATHEFKGVMLTPNVVY